jgi:hypothetical protein
MAAFANTHGFSVKLWNQPAVELYCKENDIKAALLYRRVQGWKSNKKVPEAVLPLFSAERVAELTNQKLGTTTPVPRPKRSTFIASRKVSESGGDDDDHEDGDGDGDDAAVVDADATDDVQPPVLAGPRATRKRLKLERPAVIPLSTPPPPEASPPLPLPPAPETSAAAAASLNQLAHVASRSLAPIPSPLSAAWETPQLVCCIEISTTCVVLNVVIGLCRND